MRDYEDLLSGRRMVFVRAENKNAQKIVRGAHFFVHMRKF